MFAILLAALAPPISQAIATKRSGPAPWSEICSVSAGKAAFGKTSPSPADQASHLKHCPFCSTHGGSAGLPPADVTLALPTAGSPVRPVLYYRSPRPLFAWVPAQSRAPPALS